MPGTILGPGDVAVNKMDKRAFPQGVYVSATLTFNRIYLSALSQRILLVDYIFSVENLLNRNFFSISSRKNLCSKSE